MRPPQAEKARKPARLSTSNASLSKRPGWPYFPLACVPLASVPRGTLGYLQTCRDVDFERATREGSPWPAPDTNCPRRLRCAAGWVAPPRDWARLGVSSPESLLMPAGTSGVAPCELLRASDSRRPKLNNHADQRTPRLASECDESTRSLRIYNLNVGTSLVLTSGGALSTRFLHPLGRLELGAIRLKILVARPQYVTSCGSFADLRVSHLRIHPTPRHRYTGPSGGQIACIGQMLIKCQ